MLEISSPRPRAYGRCLPCKWHSHSWLCSVHRPVYPACPEPRRERRAANRRVVLVLLNRAGFPSALAMTNPGSTWKSASRLAPPWQNQPAHDSAQSSRGPCTSKFIAPATPLECALAQKGWGVPLCLLYQILNLSALPPVRAAQPPGPLRSPRCSPQPRPLA